MCKVNEANQDIRLEVAGAGLRLWQIADKLSITDGWFSKKLRKELPPREKERIRQIILELKEGN